MIKTFTRMIMSAAFVSCGLLVPAARGASADEVHRFGVVEAELTADRDFDNPFWDVDVTVTLTSPSGETETIDAFWDGGGVWKFRFSPDETGRWSWTSASEPSTEGLHEQSGVFECVPYEGVNPLYVHGPLRLADDRRSIVFDDGAPFFWLGDTAWNGVLRARPEDWDRYLQTRKNQNFNLIQFVTTQWRGGREVLPDRAFEGEQRIRVHPVFYQKRDPLVRSINEHGLVAAPILLWALTESDPGRKLPIDDAIRLARYEVARYGAHQVVWLLGGDGHYTQPDDIKRWKAIGRGVFGEEDDNDRGRLASLHPSGQSWVGDIYADEPWYDLIGYQSGHGSSDDHLRWLVQGPPARPWQEQPELPILNMEPNYETHPSYHEEIRFNDFHLRRAGYWSLLVSPPAGLTFGHNAIWVWNAEPGPAENHGNVGTVPPWHEGLDTPGVRSMTVLRAYFESGPWPELRPDLSLVAEQPGADNPRRFIASARAPDGRWAVVYAPTGGSIRLNLSSLPQPLNIRFFDPRTGDFQEADASAEGASIRLDCPDDQDWVIDLRPASE